MKNLLFVGCLLVFSFFSGMVAAQNPFQVTNFPVKINGKNLKFPFAGGLNAPQFSQADLNKDGWQDLVVFDRVGNHLLTFINTQSTTESPNYEYAPEYAKNFPQLKNWAILRDFNKDGAADIFCSSITPGFFEIQVFQGYFDGNILKFKPFKFRYQGCSTCITDFIYYPDDIPGYWNNLPVSPEDIPEFVDVDGDGDLDLLTFEATVGGHVWLFNNLSVERGFGTDSLQFVLADRCWGRFYESGLVACKNSLSPNPDTCLNGFGAVEDRGERHPGSTVTAYDKNGDGKIDLILGDVSFSCLNEMTNGGTPQKAWMVAQDTFFPSYDESADVVNFPAAFILDVDNDGRKDMLVSPNARGIIEDQRNVWFYKNTGTNSNVQFRLQKTDFLVGDMIDLGTVTHPAVADVNADGLLDIVVGTQGFFTPGNPLNARLYLFLNKGTTFSPSFELTDKDWLGMSQFVPDDSEFAPAFADMDADGDLDLVVGSLYGAVYYYRNVAGVGNPMSFQQDTDPYWLDLDISQLSTPFLYDLDKDGLVDLFLGERSGNINFFKNIGTTTKPLFPTTPTIERLGNMDAKYLGNQVGNSNLNFVETFDGLLAVLGNFEGRLKTYRVTEPLSGNFPLVSDFWGQIDVGIRSHPAFADLNNNGNLECIVGNARGGLEIFNTQLKASISTNVPQKQPFQVVVSPNPATTSADVFFNESGKFTWQVVNLLGQQIATGTGAGQHLQISVEHWQTGCYFLRGVLEGRGFSAKFLVK